MSGYKITTWNFGPADENGNGGPSTAPPPSTQPGTMTNLANVGNYPPGTERQPGGTPSAGGFTTGAVPGSPFVFGPTNGPAAAPAPPPANPLLQTGPNGMGPPIPGTPPAPTPARATAPAPASLVPGLPRATAAPTPSSPVFSAPAIPQAAAGSALPSWAANPDAANFGAMAGPMKGPTSYTPTRDALVSQQLESLLAKDSPLMQRAAASAAAAANRRGLINSSIAVGAGQAAMIDAAVPIAQADAAAHFTSQRDNANAANTFSGDENNFNRQGALTKFKTVFDLAAHRDSMAMEGAKLATGNAQFGAELGLKANAQQQTAWEATQRNSLDVARLNADVALRERTLGADEAKLAAESRQRTLDQLAAMRSKATDGLIALEQSQNLDGPAKAAAIGNLMARVSDDMRATIVESGLNIPNAWPEATQRQTVNPAVPVPSTPGPSPAAAGPVFGGSSAPAGAGEPFVDGRYFDQP